MTDDTSRCAPSEQTLTRATVVLFLFVLWSLAITVRLSQFMIFRRTHYLDSAMDRSVYRGTIAPLRGRILDRDGTPLAWSTRRFSLHWHVPPEGDRALAAWRAMAADTEALGLSLTEAEILDVLGRKLELSGDLNETTVSFLESALGKHRGIELECRFVRQYHPDPGLDHTLGRTQTQNGVEVGVSGAEKSHDALLRGVSGEYTVMRNRKGQWLTETWRNQRDMRSGYDVYLPIRAPKEGPGSP